MRTLALISRIVLIVLLAYSLLTFIQPALSDQQNPPRLSPTDQSLITAARSADTVGVLQALNAGTNPNACTPQGQTVLDVAYQAWSHLPDSPEEQGLKRIKRMDLIKVLLDHGATLQKESRLGQQLMFDALNIDRYDVARLITSQGVELKESVYAIIRSNKLSPPGPDPDRRKVFDYWLAHPYMDRGNGTLLSSSEAITQALFLAVSANDGLYFTQKLLARGADINAR